MSLTGKLKLVWQRRRWAVVSVAGAVLLVGGFGAVRLVRSAPNVPTGEVTRGEFVEYLQLRGEVKAVRSVVLSAPSRAGDVQLVQLVKNGATVKKGDLVAQFDVANMQRTLDQRRSDLKQAEAEIERMKAQARLQEELDLTELAKARYDVERARLEASKQEILSEIEGEKNKLNLANAQQKLREAEEKLQSDGAAAAAEVESRKQRRDKALFDVRQAERNIAALTLRAPADGMVTLMPNFRAGSSFGNAPEWKQGDRAWPGAAIAELPDLSSVQVTARIDESDRGRLKPGQAATVRVDAVPDKELAGRVVEISPLAKPDFSSWPVTKNFDLVVSLEQGDARLRPGMSATARVAVERVPDAVQVPAEAVFQKGGRSVAYVLASRGLGTRFEERAVEVGRRSGGKVAVARGVQPGEKVALRDPRAEEKR